MESISSGVQCREASRVAIGLIEDQRKCLKILGCKDGLADLWAGATP